MSGRWHTAVPYTAECQKTRTMERMHFFFFLDNLEIWHGSNVVRSALSSSEDRGPSDLSSGKMQTEIQFYFGEKKKYERANQNSALKRLRFKHCMHVQILLTGSILEINNACIINVLFWQVNFWVLPCKLHCSAEKCRSWKSAVQECADTGGVVYRGNTEFNLHSCLNMWLTGWKCGVAFSGSV